MRRILVTGGTGLVGRALQGYVEQHQATNDLWLFASSKDGDLRDAGACADLFNANRPTHVIHLECGRSV
jgi:GDP-L-fucose synthase